MKPVLSRLYWSPAVWFLAGLLCLSLPSTPRAAEPVEVMLEDFEQGLGPGWKEKSFSGHTEYLVVPDGNGHCLQATSRAAASGLALEKEYRLQDYPILSWRWKIEEVLSQGDARHKDGDDYAARVYVVFPHWFFPKTHSLNYIWANRLPRGEVVPNPFTGNAMMVAVESGNAKRGEWIEERRNVLDDYRRIFGEEPPPVGAIAIMTDTDNTGGTAKAWYDDIRIGRGGD